MISAGALRARAFPVRIHRWKIILAAALGSFHAGCHRPDSARVDPPPSPLWVVSPDTPGENTPPSGRALFDYIATDDSGAYRIPFPFTALLKHIERKAGCTPQRDPLASCLKIALIPLGRSLQRTAATPDFFSSPRVVVAVDGEPVKTNGMTPLLKDRLYLGYQEHSQVLEVISYNETAGRFEFQLVRNYRAGATPEVVYADRVICTACHQNQAPIFSRPLWDETDANPAVAAKLLEHRRDFYGIVPGTGVDIPNAVDDATDRANLFSATQTLWREGCAHADNGKAVRCRAALLRAALRYRLGDTHDVASLPSLWRTTSLPVLDENAATRWQQGLAIPNPDIPNRDPLQPTHVGAALPSGRALTHVPARFEPLERRAPLETWISPETNFVQRAVLGIAGFFAQADIERLRQKSINEISTALAEMIAATETGTTDALSDKPLRREAILSFMFPRLGLRATDCCAKSLPPLQIDDASNNATALYTLEKIDPSARLLYSYCAACHRTPETFPANFLYGDAEQVKQNLRQCAQRIFVRLGMSRLPDHQRAKTPMPPRVALDRLHLSPSSWAASGDFAEMTSYIESLLPKESPYAGRLLSIGNDYEHLTPCMQ